MLLHYYKEAQKLANKERRACVNYGLYPYLPVLDEALPADRAIHTQDLGLVNIPAQFIAGTKTAQRTNAFARNFMPLLGEKTEFAEKWMHLCQAHLDVGINQPIRAYEYMHRYYVAEGNKRVSVLKFFDAVSIPGQVTRILPERTGEPEIEVYYEFLDFNKVSTINFIEFSHTGCYADLQRLMGKQPGQRWSQDEERAFSTLYYRFLSAYRACGGEKLTSTVGDALLACIRIYGYQELRMRTDPQLKQAVSMAWEEIRLIQEDQTIDLKLTPEQMEEKKPGVLSRVLPSAEPKLQRVAFINDKSPSSSGWTNGHELGRLHVQQVFNGQILTTAYHDAMAGNPFQVIQRAIADGNSTIFTTSPRLLPASLRAAVEHPEVTILNCSINKSHRYIRTYYARMYEAKFIIGAIAGSLAQLDRVGYICDYPIFGQIAGINAFAQGVRMVNPRAKVYLEWSSVHGLEGARRRLTEQGILLISSQDLLKQDEEPFSFGLASVVPSGPVNLAVPVWQWGRYYEMILRRILNRTFQSEYAESTKALNYYWGMAEGVVELRCSQRLPEGTRRLADFLRRSICSGVCKPFQGPLRTQDGRIVPTEGEGDLSAEQIVSMDYLAQSVVGALPDYEQLSREAQDTVDRMGVSLINSGRKP